jgi:hypothetical protein
MLDSANGIRFYFEKTGIGKDEKLSGCPSGREGHAVVPGDGAANRRQAREIRFSSYAWPCPFGGARAAGMAESQRISD